MIDKAPEFIRWFIINRTRKRDGHQFTEGRSFPMKLTKLSPVHSRRKPGKYYAIISGRGPFEQYTVWRWNDK